MVVILEQRQTVHERVFHLHRPDAREEKEHMKIRTQREQDADSLTYFEVKLEALILKNFAFASEATALA
jgi:hypothetical protein